MNHLSIIVRATWDDEAEVWVAQSADVQGLATEAPTLEELREKILAIIPELIELNGVESNLAEIPVHIMAERTARVVNPRY
jgi:predicted RNase H-like HicB family nuclease